MVKRSNYEIVLSIETALSGGSLALCRDGMVCAVARSESRSESLLPAINVLLQEASLAARDVTSIAVSLGPGSFTGIRIGVATALGLKASLGVPCIGISSTEAVASASPDVDRCAVVPVGRGQYSAQYFRAGQIEASVSPQFYVVSEDDLCQMVIGKAQNTFVFANEISITDFDRLTQSTNTQNAIFLEKATAELMCDFVVNRHSGSDLTPIYARPETNQVR